MTATERELVDRVESLMRILGSKWKPAIIFCLVFNGPLRFTELRKAIPEITQKMLTQRLRELERDGLVKRTFYEEIPPRVEYEITELGSSVHPLFKSLCDWGKIHIQDILQANAGYDRISSDRER